MLIASADQMRELDRSAPNLQELMERAGAAVFERVAGARRLGVVCGTGNNGGDGFVVARLAREAGIDVRCFLIGDESGIQGPAKAALDRLRAAGLSPNSNPEGLATLQECDVVVDALLGTGAAGDLRDGVRCAVEAVNACPGIKVAVDVPSGIDCDTGKELGVSVAADETVTFGYAKPFLFQGQGVDHAGAWNVADIGLPLLHEDQAFGRLLDASWVAARLPRRKADSNKGSHGHVLVVAGSHRMRGAPTLVARAALRSGAGLVTVAGPEEVCAAVAAQLPEVLLLPLGEDPVREILEYQERVDAGVFGPGLGTESAVRDLLANVFESWSRPAVVDADALNAVAAGVRLPGAECVLTPHPGEAARLLGCTVQDVQADRFASLAKLADSTGKAVLLKGRYSLASSPGKQVLVNPTGNPGLATGGTGDTLCGIIATLLAQDVEAPSAAACAMFWHGVAADDCSRDTGAVGYSATDIAMALPAARDRLI
jgi:NAD(P)H-hydrate epimerase